MSNSPLEQPIVPSTTRTTDLAALLSALGQVVASSEPAVVLTSLAASCVPALSDECLVLLTENDNTTYQISYPQPPPRASLSRVPDWYRATSRTRQIINNRWISTPIQAPAGSDEQAYHGVLVHCWREGFSPGSTEAALAHDAANRAVALISRERSEDRLRAAEGSAAGLWSALNASREIGAAIGILMATYKLSQPQAFDQLRTISQHSHRKLRDIAADVVFTGALENSDISLAAPQNSPALPIARARPSEVDTQ